MTTNTTLVSFLASSDIAARDRCLVTAVARAGAEVAATLAHRAADIGARADGAVNVHGELVREMDLVANDAFISELARDPYCGGVLTEETRVPLDFRAHGAERFVFLDPLDGSGNLDTHGVTGSIFGVVPWAGSAGVSASLPGKELVLAGYLLYSSATLLVLASKERVSSFVWHPELAEFVLCQADVQCPPRGNLYSINEANVGRWPSRARGWLTRLKAGQLFGGRKYSQRYAGTLVADAHRALLKGGVFAYPGDSAAPHGKLRLQYEVNPMAFIFRAAGGAATTGNVDPLEVRPESCHERCPLVLGSREEVESYESLFATAPDSVEHPSQPLATG